MILSKFAVIHLCSLQSWCYKKHKYRFMLSKEQYYIYKK